MAARQYSALACVLILLAPSASWAGPRLNWTPYLTMIGGNAADLLTTHQAFNRGAVEGNGVVSGQPFGTIAASKVSFVLGLGMLMRLLETHGHPTWAKAIGYIDGGTTFAIATHNARVAR